MRKIELVLWFRCNTRCRFCVADPAAARESMDTRAALRHLERARGEGAVEVDFGGGEPTLREDLPALARAAKALGYRGIGVKSNGLRLCYPELVETLRGAGVDSFALPVWGPSPSGHDALSRVDGSFEMMEMAAKHVLDLGGRLELDVLLTTMTVPALGPLTRAFARIGVRRFSMWLYCLFGSRQALPELLPTLTDAGRAVARTASSLREDGARVSTTHIPPCFLPGAGGLYANVADAGLVIITPGGSFPAQDSPFEAGVKTAKCAGCSELGRCAGIRPEYLRRYSDAEVRPLRAARAHG